uniref:Putative glycosyltransferase n=1 Tax=viral metagenome TaxID=1070528 RepID=A0A6M3KD07_9ZZZZ
MRILILTDIDGWAMDTIADGLVSMIRKKTNYDVVKMRAGTIDIKENYEKFEIIYVMIPSFIPDDLDDYSKIRTTFHGGLAVSNQADHIMAEKLSDRIPKISYVSRQVKDRVQSSKIKNLIYTPYGVDTTRFECGGVYSEDRVMVGWAGWANYLMGKQENQRRCSWIMRSQQDLNYRLKIAGGSPDYPRGVEIFNELYPNINCNTYSKDDIPNFYKGINLYLVPDVFAGGPIPVLEAGASGVTVITTPCGICETLIKHNHNGLIVNNYKEFYESIKRLMDDPEGRMKLGRNLREDIHNKRTWESVFNHWKNFLIG